MLHNHIAQLATLSYSPLTPPKFKMSVISNPGPLRASHRHRNGLFPTTLKMNYTFQIF